MIFKGIQDHRIVRQIYHKEYYQAIMKHLMHIYQHHIIKIFLNTFACKRYKNWLYGQ